MDFALIRRTWSLFKDFHRYFYVSLSVLLLQELLGLKPGIIWGSAITALVDRTNWKLFAILNMSMFLIKMLLKGIDDLRDRYEKKTQDFRVPRYIREKVLRHLTCELSLGTLKGQHTGLTHSIITQGENSIHLMINGVMYRFLPSAMGLVVTAGIMLYVNWQLGLISIAGVSTYAFLVTKINKAYRKDQETANDMRNSLSRFHTEALKGMALVKIFSREAATLEENERQSIEADEFRKKMVTAKRTRLRGVWFFIFATTTVVYHIAGLKIFAGTMKIGTIVMFMTWWGNMQTYFQELSNLNTEWSDLIPSIGKYFRILDIKDDGRKPGNGLEKQIGDIRFENVSFIYPKPPTIEDQDEAKKRKHHEPKQVLKDMDFFIPAGKMTAIVGRSGNGKTTLLNLLIRAYDPTDGFISLNGSKLTDWSSEEILKHIGYVPQKPLLFEKSIRYNCQFAGDHVTDELIMEVADEVGLGEFIRGLEEGLSTKVGENGYRLSGGEMQRLALLMALLRRPKILLLDEPTSSLDSETQKLIKQTIRKYAEKYGTTTIVIAHRLSTIKNADQIAVLEHGRIAAAGTHRELLARCDLYRRVYEEEMLVD